MGPNDTPNSRRIDISKEGLPRPNRLVEGRKYFDVSHPAISDIKPVLQLIKKDAAEQKGS